MTKRNSNKKQHNIVKTNKKRKTNSKDLVLFSAQSSDSTKVTVEDSHDISTSTIIEKSNKNLAFYMYLHGLDMKKQNKNNLNFESSFMILKSGFYGCSKAVFHIFDNMSSIMGCILGFTNQVLSNEAIYQEAYFFLGFFLFYYKEIKKYKSFIDWLNTENPDLIIEEESDLQKNDINFTTYKRLNESVMKNTKNSMSSDILDNELHLKDSDSEDNEDDFKIKKSPIVIPQYKNVRERNNMIKKKLSFDDFNEVKNTNKKCLLQNINTKKNKYDIEIPQAKIIAKGKQKQIIHGIDIFKEDKYPEYGVTLFNKQTFNKPLSEIFIKLKYCRLNSHNIEVKKEYLELLDKNLYTNNEVILFLYAYQYLITSVMKLDIYLKEKKINNLNISSLISKEKINHCISLLEISAKKNFYLSQYYLSESLLNGKYNSYMNDKEAFYHMSACCDNGMNKAYYHLSDYYRKSIGVHSKIKHKYSFENMKNAYESKYYEAGVRLAIMYKDGVGIEQNHKMAFHIIKKTYLKHKVLDACYTWGLFFFEGIGIEADPDYGMKLLELAALKGHKDSIILVGKLCMYGEYNINIDLDKAFHYFKTAAKFNIHEGICWLAIFFYEHLKQTAKFTHFIWDAISKDSMETLSFLYKNKHYFSSKLIKLLPFDNMEYIKKKLQKL